MWLLLRFLQFWYSRQQLCVRWNSSLSVPFSVSNGVRQGSILSPFLFSVYYVDGLLLELSKSGVGCFWGSVFAGAFCYTDDIVLLAPCASALWIMLDICNSCAIKRKLEFNAYKTQLICFHLPCRSIIIMHPQSATILLLFNIVLQYSSKVTHLGHILTSTLDDSEVIARVLKNLIRKADSVLCTIHHVDPFVKTFLIKSYCLSLYGASIWSLGAKQIRNWSLQKFCGRYGIFPQIVILVLHIALHIIMDTINNVVYRRFQSLLSSAFFLTIVHGLFLLSLHFMFLLLLVTTVCMVPNK